eukprot:SAG31_NODE_2812_length_5052_cov_2.155663_4_plen_83_part_00
MKQKLYKKKIGERLHEKLLVKDILGDAEFSYCVVLDYVNTLNTNTEYCTILCNTPNCKIKNTIYLKLQQIKLYLVHFSVGSH